MTPDEQRVIDAVRRFVATVRVGHLEDQLTPEQAKLFEAYDELERLVQDKEGE